jgi:hypothetical protein
VHRGEGNLQKLLHFEADEGYVLLWQKHKAVISEFEASRKRFIGPKKGRFPETDDAVFVRLQERRKTRINCTVLFLWPVHWPYFFQNPALNRKSSSHTIQIHTIFSPLKL